MHAGYRTLPAVYDRWQNSYGKDFSTLILPKLLATIRRFGVRRGAMVDVACGTGTLALMMARRGWAVTAVDASPGMIAEAAKKARGRPRPITLLLQDMRSLRVASPVTLATCLFDSLNHLLTPAHLRKAFRAVHRSLLPGGYFMFDMNNERCFEQLWNSTEAVRHSDFTLVLANSYDAERRLAQSQVSLFRRRGDAFVRSEETVRERCYADEDVGAMLEECGFRVLLAERFGFSGAPRVGKVKTWWVAQR